jgi:hypothetical protein
MVADFLSRVLVVLHIHLFCTFIFNILFITTHVRFCFRVLCITFIIFNDTVN